MTAKKALFFILLLVIFSCKKDTLIDIEEPQLENIFQSDSGLFLQFNEPVKTLKLYHEKNCRTIENIFPVANNIITLPKALDKQKIILSIEATDTSNNIAFIQDKTVNINTNPAKFSFISLNVKYSKKKKQKIILKTVKPGYLNGFSILIFQNKKLTKIPFTDEFFRSAFIELFVDRNNQDPLHEDCKKSISSKNNHISLKNRLSKIYGLIIIENNNEEIEDYFLYYNLKEHEKEYYLKNKSFIYIRNYLASNSIDTPLIRDISKF